MAQSSSGAKARPFGATVLAVLAGIAAVLAALHTLQSMGIIPYAIGPISFRDFNLWYTFMWALMVWIWIWLVQMLWHVEPAAWLFLAAISTINLVFIVVAMIGAGSWSDVSLSFIVNGLILLYVMLPGTRRAFGQK